MKYTVAVLGLALLLAACGNTPSVPSTGQGDNNLAVTGTVVELDSSQSPFPNLPLKAWTGGAGQVNGSSVDSSGKATVLTTGTLNADGTFSMALPTTVASANLEAIGEALDLQDQLPEGLNCTAALVASDTAAKGTTLLVTVKGQKTGAVSASTQSGQVNESTGVGTLNTSTGTYLYSDRAVSIVGKQTCTGTYKGLTVQATLNSNIQLKQGWNAVSNTTVFQFDQTTFGVTVTTQTGALPTSKWIYDGSFGTQSLPNLPFRR